MTYLQLTLFKVIISSFNIYIEYNLPGRRYSPGCELWPSDLTSKESTHSSWCSGWTHPPEAGRSGHDCLPVVANAVRMVTK